MTAGVMFYIVLLLLVPAQNVFIHYGVIERDKVTLQCNNNCSSDPVEWTDPDDKVVSSSVHYVIETINRSDTGNYTCSSSNVTTAVYYIDVYYDPEIVDSPLKVNGNQGKDFTLDCACFVREGNPGNDSYTYQWTGPFGYSAERILHITSVNSNHSGEYRCHIGYELRSDIGYIKTGTLTARVQVCIKYKGSETTVIGRRGERVALNVTNGNNPIPVISWRRLDSQSALGNNTVEIPGGILSVHLTSGAVYGLYEANVSSCEENVTFTFSIIANSHPFPVENATVVSTTESTINVTWLPSYDGGAVATYYVIHAKVGDAKWTFSTSTSESSLEIIKLSPDTVYNLRIIGQNVYGTMPLDLAVNMTTKTDTASGVAAIFRSEFGLYVGVGLGAGGCLFFVLLIFCIVKFCCCRRNEDPVPHLRASLRETADGQRISSMAPVNAEVAGNVYEIVPNSAEITGAEGSAYDMPHEVFEHEQRKLRYPRKPVTPPVKTIPKVKARKQKTALSIEGAAYEDPVSIQQELGRDQDNDIQEGDITYKEYEDIPDLVTHQKLRQRSRVIPPPEHKSQKAKRFPFAVKPKVPRNVEPYYVNKSMEGVNRGEAEPGYLDMGTLRVATVTQMYEDMTRDFWRKRKSKVKNILTRKKSQSLKDDYINVTEMDIGQSSCRNSDEPLLYVNVKESSRRGKDSNRQERAVSSESHKKKGRFPFFSRSNKAKDPPPVDTCMENSNTDSNAYVDVQNTWDNLPARSHPAAGFYGDSDPESKETGIDSDDEGSECSKTTDSLCDEMMEQENSHSLNVDIHSSAQGQSYDYALVVKSRNTDVRRHGKERKDGDV